LHKYTLAPGRYVGFVDESDTDEPVSLRLEKLMSLHKERRVESEALEQKIVAALKLIRGVA